MAEVKPLVGVDLQIHRATRRVLHIPFIELGHAACTAIVGPNGAGKSLLIRTLCALQQPDRGAVSWGGIVPDSDRRQKVGLLLQRPVLLRRTAIQNIIYPLRISGISSSVARDVALQSLTDAGLSAVVHVFAHKLSGGEQQRLALARALALKPDMLFMDEATANVDPASTQAIEHQLAMAMARGLGVVFISHDIGQVKRLADEVVLMHKGEVVEQCTSKHFFEQTNNPVSRRWLAGELLV